MSADISVQSIGFCSEKERVHCLIFFLHQGCA